MDSLLISFESLDTRVNPFIRVQPVLLRDVRGQHRQRQRHRFRLSLGIDESCRTRWYAP